MFWDVYFLYLWRFFVLKISKKYLFAGGGGGAGAGAGGGGALLIGIIIVT